MQEGKLNRLYSSGGESLKTLAKKVSPERTDRFLCELANFPERQGPRDQLPEDYLKAWDRLRNLYGDLFPSYGNPDEGPGEHGLVWEYPDDPGALNLEHTPPELRQAWLIPTALGREVWLMGELAYYLRGPAMFAIAEKARQSDLEARELAQKSGATLIQAIDAGWKARTVREREETEATRSDWVISDAAIDEFALVLLRAMHIADRMRYCQNPSCPAPYFLAKRRSQKYCSDACSLPAQREFKRAWWQDHGEEWRAKRAKKKEAKRGSRKSQRKRGK